MAVIPCLPAIDALFVPVVFAHPPAGVDNAVGTGNQPDMTDFSLRVVEEGEVAELRLCGKDLFSAECLL